MSSKPTIIDLFGIDKYEITIYLAILLRELKYKVLLIDKSESMALTTCISIPRDYDTKKCVVHHNGLDFINREPQSEELQNYDYILIDYGFKDIRHTSLQAHKHIIVTDKQLHNIKKLQFDDKEKDTYLIFKNSNINDRTELLTSFFNENLKIIRSYFLFYEETDIKYMHQLQYEKCVKGISRQMGKLVKDCMETLFHIDKKEIKSAYKKLKKG